MHKPGSVDVMFIADTGFCKFYVFFCFLLLLCSKTVEHGFSAEDRCNIVTTRVTCSKTIT